MSEPHKHILRLIVCGGTISIMAFADAVGFATAPHALTLPEEETAEVEQLNSETESKVLKPYGQFPSTETPEEAPPFHIHPDREGKLSPNELLRQALAQSEEGIPTARPEGFILTLHPKRIRTVPHLVIDGVPPTHDHIEVEKRGHPVIKDGGEDSAEWALATKSARQMWGDEADPDRLSLDLEGILRLSHSVIATVLQLLATDHHVAIGRDFATSDFPPDIEQMNLPPMLELSDFRDKYWHLLPKPPRTWNSALTRIPFALPEIFEPNPLSLKPETPIPHFSPPRPYDWITALGGNTVPLHTSISHLRIFSKEELTAFRMW